MPEYTRMDWLERALGDLPRAEFKARLKQALERRAAMTTSTLDTGTRVRQDATARLRVSNAAFVSATTNGSGNAGDISAVVDGPVVLDGAGLEAFTGIGANTPAGGPSAGRGGTVSLRANSVTVREGAVSHRRAEAE